jgi:hypothetical protein
LLLDQLPLEREDLLDNWRQILASALVARRAGRGKLTRSTEHIHQDGGVNARLRLVCLPSVKDALQRGRRLQSCVPASFSVARIVADPRGLKACLGGAAVVAGSLSDEGQAKQCVGFRGQIRIVELLLVTRRSDQRRCRLQSLPEIKTAMTALGTNLHLMDESAPYHHRWSQVEIWRAKAAR